MKAIVVGNGPVEFDAGEKIDSFDVVIRINDFKIKGFEKLVGTKTDIWVPGGLPYPKGFGGKPDVPIWALYPYHSRKDMIEKMSMEFQKRIVKLDTRIMNELQFKLGLNIHTNGRFTSTGVSTLEYAMKEFGEVWYIGFTFGTEHYDGKNEKGAKCHNFFTEKLYVINEFKMKELT